MRPQTIALLTSILLLLTPATSQALELGVQDDGQMRSNPTAVLDAGDDLHARWVRMIFRVGDPTAPLQIRYAHTRGFKVLVTLGGTGTPTRQPTARALLRYLRTLPQAERYTVINEPDQAGITACAYRKTWMAVRRVLGRKLLFGDFSPHWALRMTAAISKCGPLPKTVGFALHPYQMSDPLAHGPDEGSLGNLGHMRKWLKHHAGIRVEWWLDEFAYLAGPATERMDKWLTTDAHAAALWPRAILQAKRNHARMLGIYMAQGASWDSRPRDLAWSVLTGRQLAPAFLPDVRQVTFDPGYR